MKYLNIFDTHTHSIHSFDGHHSCEELCKGIIKNGGIGIAITDHCDIDGMKSNCWEFEDKQFADVLKAKGKFADLTVLNGVELGQPLFQKELSEEFLQKYDFDFVLGSVHNLENMEDFYFLDYKKYGVEATQTMNDLWLSVKTSTANTTTYLILTLVAIAAVAAFFIISGAIKRRRKARRCRKWKQA